jgi:hypothetical protein
LHKTIKICRLNPYTSNSYTQKTTEPFQSFESHEKSLIFHNKKDRPNAMQATKHAKNKEIIEAHNSLEAGRSTKFHKRKQKIVITFLSTKYFRNNKFQQKHAFTSDH